MGTITTRRMPNMAKPEDEESSAPMHITRQQAMESYSVHNLTKEVLELSKDKDIVDRYHDVKLALAILKDEMDRALGITN